MRTIQAIRGMKDIPPAETPFWRHVESVAQRVVAMYGYQELRPPIVEKTELFRRSVGEGTDIVEKEMYTFTDRNGDSITLRPECTASCVRAAVEHGWLRGARHRLWHIGPMFRHERPQKGRYRQFHQLDVEALGFVGPDIDAELILLSARLWRELGLEGIRLELNSLGTPDAQAEYRERLIAYFEEHRDALDEDSVRRLATSPLRILDSKNPDMQELIGAAPSVIEHLDAGSAEHFEELKAMLAAAGVDFVVNPRLVRGLDYYTRTVFEWVTDELGSQNAVCGGGRYDGLVADIGGPATPATGFAVGLERLVDLVREKGLASAEEPPDAYLLAVGGEAQRAAHTVAERLRDEIPQLRLIVDAGPGSFKTKMKGADRSNARLALILGEDELRSQRIAVKDMRGDSAQTSVTRARLGDHLRTRLAVSE